MKELVANEEHIGKMFDAFNTLTEQWNAIGNVPGDQYKEVHDAWHRLRDEFFYNVNIYKQLQDHDLQVNLKKKEDLIAQAAQLSSVTDLKEKELLTRSYMKAWFDVGPSPRETYQEMADTFFGHTRGALEEIKAHFDGIREGFIKNLEAKQALVEEVRALVEADIQSPSRMACTGRKGQGGSEAVEDHRVCRPQRRPRSLGEFPGAVRPVFSKSATPHFRMCGPLKTKCGSANRPLPKKPLDWPKARLGSKLPTN